MTLRNALSKIWRGVLICINFLGKAFLVVGVAFLIYWLSVYIYKTIYIKQPRSLTLNLTEFGQIYIHNKQDCGLIPFLIYPYQVRIHDLASNFFLDYELTSKQPIDFSIVFPDGKMIATNYAVNQSQGISSAEIIVQEGTSYFGQVKKIELEIIHAPEIELEEFVCSPEFNFSSSASSANWYDYEIRDRDHDLNGVVTRYWLKVGDKLKVTLSGELNLNNYDSHGLRKIEFEIEATADQSPLGITALSPGLKAKIPFVPNYSKTTDPTVFPWKEVSASGDDIEVRQPKGLLKLGNEDVIELGKTIQNPDEKLSASGGISVSGNMVTHEYVVSTRVTSVTLNGEELIKTPWETLSGETKVGVIGLLFTFIGGLWVIRGSIQKVIIPKRFQQKPVQSTPPPIGSFICVMQSGVILAGNLVREPSLFFPYFILRNVHRRQRTSLNWDREIIGEIRVRANQVEQSYFLGK